MKTKNNFIDGLIIDGVIFLMGMVLLTQFYTLLFQGVFAPEGWADRLANIAHYLHDGSWQQLIVSLLAHVNGLLFGLLLLCAAIACVLLIARGIASMSVGVGFFLAWALLWSYPGMWTFEFFFPAFFALTAGFAKLSYPTFTPSIFYKLGLSKKISFIFILLITIFLWYVTSIAFYDPSFAAKVAYCSAASLFVLLLLQIGIVDDWIARKEIQDQPSYTVNLRSRVARWPWIDIMIICIGTMMVMQVYSNYFSGLFELNNYKALIEYYAVASADHWLHPFLRWSAEYSYVLLPLQMIFETAVAILLTLLILRGPVLLLTTGLFGILAFAELGVSASWPPDATDLTWEWELLLVTGVGALISTGKIIELQKAKSFKNRVLGNKIYSSVPLWSQFMIAVLGGLTLYAIGMATQVFGEAYHIISISSGMTLFILLILLALLDRYRD